MTLIYFFALADVFLVLRFGLVGFTFALLYETTKGFLFGERFLAESMIVYPLVYLLGIVWQKKIYRFEPILAAVAAWFVVFSREPYIPLGIFLLGVFVWKTRSAMALLIFLILSVVTTLSLDAASYIWSVTAVNSQAYQLASRFGGLTVVRMFGYPVEVFISGPWNLLRQIELGIALALIAGCVGAWKNNKSFVLFSFVVLGLANIRPEAPGRIYYEAFHHLVWYALAIVIILFFSKRGWIIVSVLAMFAFFSPQSYLHENVNRIEQFGIGYGHYIMQGEIIRRLADPSNTLFLEEWDDLIYWQAKLPTPYPYSWYTSVMGQFPKYTRAREDMFRTNPPDFYYGQCHGEQTSLPQSLKDNYIRLTQSGAPTCIFVKNEIAEKIPDERWIAVRDFSIDRE